MRFYKIEFYSSIMHQDNAHRLKVVERQYTSIDRARAAAERMMQNIYKCKAYSVKVL